MSLDQFRILGEGLDHPECVACGPDGSTYPGGDSIDLDPLRGKSCHRAAGDALGMVQAFGPEFELIEAHRRF